MRKNIRMYVIGLLVITFLPCCVKEKIELEAEKCVNPLNLDNISSWSGSSFREDVSCDSLNLTFTVPASSEATRKARLAKGIKEEVQKCAVRVDSHIEGNNPMETSSSLSTKAIYDSNSTIPFTGNVLRLDENVDAQHTALYTFNGWNQAKLLESEVVGAPDNSSGNNYRALEMKPEQAYKYYSYKEDESTFDIYYHTRLLAWSPQVCKIGTDGKTYEFGNTRYANYFTLVGDRYGVVFNHALDGHSDLMMSTIAEGQRWHDPSTPSYRDVARKLVDTNYRQPFGYNNDQEPHYENPMFFKHYLSAVRIWATLEQSSESSTLNISTWGQINSVTFLQQPGTCTILFPQTISTTAFGDIHSWSDYMNFNACGEPLYGEGDANHPGDIAVSYPVFMTDADILMEKKYLGYALVKPGEDINIAIQTSAGTYQATLPCEVEGKQIFQEGKIYDVVMNLDTEGSVADFIENEDTGYYEDLSPYNNEKAEFQTANCYIVDVNHIADLAAGGTDDSVPGFCFIGTIIGNGENGIMSKGVTQFHTNSATISTPASAKLLWQSENGLISNVHLQHGYIRFQTPPGDGGNFRKGNAVIAALDSEGKIVWSWHIWITETPSPQEVQGVSFMDRNLGALTVTDNKVVPTTSDEALKLYGLYYQWGRKDPLPGPLKYNQSSGQSMRITPVYNTYSEKITSLGTYVYNQAESIVDGIEKPLHYLINPTSSYYDYNWTSEKIDFMWGEAILTSSGDNQYRKSIYDPCPYGYHVPAEEVQYLAETATERTLGTYGQTLDGVFFPYAGFYGPDRNQSANDGAAYYCGSKGDYQSSVICNDEDGVMNSYFRNHRMRTYLSAVPNWVEQNTDGNPSFAYNAPNYYVTTDVNTHHDFTNRRTAASVRCIKESNYELLIDSRLSSLKTIISTEENTDITFNVSGRTNKGVINSAILKLYYTNSSGSTVTMSSTNLRDVSTVILTSKTLTGNCVVNVPASEVLKAQQKKINASLEITVKQGDQLITQSSDPVVLSPEPTLNIITDYDGSDSNMIDEYSVDDSEYKLVKNGNLFAPVAGQGTTFCVYVNSTSANVYINNQKAQVNTSKGIEKGDLYYPYTVSGLKWGSRQWGEVVVSCSADGYKTVTKTYHVPVYGISRKGSAITSVGAQKARGISSGLYTNWYLFVCYNYGSESDYVQWGDHRDGKRLILSSTNIPDVSYLFSFETGANASSKIYNAAFQINNKLSGDKKTASMTIISNNASGSTYKQVSVSNGQRYSIAFYNDSYYWTSYDDRYVVFFALTGADRFVFYEVDYNLPE